MALRKGRRLKLRSESPCEKWAGAGNETCALVMGPNTSFREQFQHVWLSKGRCCYYTQLLTATLGCLVNDGMVSGFRDGKDELRRLCIKSAGSTLSLLAQSSTIRPTITRTFSTL